MNPFYSALEEGYSPEDIIGYVSKAIPGIGKSVKKATKAGYTIQQILGFLSKNFNTEDKRGMSETEIHAANRRSDAAMTKYGLKMTAAAVVAPLATQAARSALSRALPQSLVSSSLQPSNQYDTQGNMPYQQQPSSPQQPSQQTTPNLESQASQQPPVSPNVSQVSNAVQPEINPIKSNADVLWNELVQGKQHKVDPSTDAFLKMANRMKSTGEIGNKEDFDRFHDLFQQKQSEGKSIPASLKEATNEFDKQKLGGQAEEAKPIAKDQTVATPQGVGDVKEIRGDKALIDVDGKLDKIPIEESSDKPKFEKRMFVKTPKGVGEIREIRNGKVLIDVDNKVQQFNENELEGSPFSEDDIADKYDSLMAHIPEAHKSSWIQFAQYDEKTNTLGFIPRGGTFEILDDITPEEAKMIKEGSGIARTSGETQEGLWNIAESTKGGVVSQIIWDRKKRNQEEENKQGKFGFIEGLERPEKEKTKEILFEELQFPRSLSKEREREKKKTERERKKNEKNKRKK